MKRTNHVIPTRNGWSVLKSGASRALKIFENKNEAIKFARTLSINERTILYVHNQSGMIQNRDSFENYTYASLGKK